MQPLDLRSHGLPTLLQPRDNDLEIVMEDMTPVRGSKAQWREIYYLLQEHFAAEEEDTVELNNAYSVACPACGATNYPTPPFDNGECVCCGELVQIA